MIILKALATYHQMAVEEKLCLAMCASFPTAPQALSFITFVCFNGQFVVGWNFLLLELVNLGFFFFLYMCWFSFLSCEGRKSPGALTAPFTFACANGSISAHLLRAGWGTQGARTGTHWAELCWLQKLFCQSTSKKFSKSPLCPQHGTKEKNLFF